jgi:DNA mismatch repair protein MutS
VAKLAGVPRAVLARAAQVLGALEARARGLDPLSDELPLFARPAAEAPPPAAPPPQAAVERHPALEALAGLDPDSLSPREAHEMIYRLRSLMDGAVNNA